MGAGNNVHVSMLITAFGSTPFFSAIESASLREYPAEEIRKFPTSLTSVAAPTSSPKSKRLCPPSPSGVVGRVLWRSVDRQRESRAGERQPPPVFQRWVPQYRGYHVVHAVPHHPTQWWRQSPRSSPRQLVGSPGARHEQPESPLCSPCGCTP